MLALDRASHVCKDSSRSASATGVILGTPAYLAPEQVRGQAIDERADLYAVGVILFEALTRRLPFVGADFDVMSAHVGRTPPSMRSILGEAVIPEAIEEVVSRGARRAPINSNDAADQSFVPGHPPGSRPVSDHSRPRGIAEALVAVLTQRGFDLGETDRRRVLECGDLRLLQVWLGRVLTAKSLAEVFAA